MIVQVKQEEYNSGQPESSRTVRSYQYIEQLVDKLEFQNKFSLPAGFKIHCEIFEALMQRI